MSEWKQTTLGEISDDVSYGYTESAVSEKIGPKFLRITDIQGGVVNWDKVPYCRINESNLSKYRLNPGDIVVARTGNSTGENFLYSSNEKEAVYASYLIKFSINKNINARYIWYSMRSREWWGFIQGNKTGSAQAGANAKTLSNFPINLPPLPEQKAIAHILGKLDDKIELNRKMNKTLEAMAQALFKSWFVDFDPVIDNALAAGHPIPEALQAKAAQRQKLVNAQSSATGAAGEHGSPSAAAPRLLDTNPALAALFPNTFTYNESLGKWIPEGWEVKTIDEAATVVGGGTPSTKESAYYTTNGIPWLSPKDLSGYNWKYISKGATDITELGLQKSSATLMPKGSVLFSSRAPIGYIAIAENEVTTNQGFKSLIPNMGVPTEYLFQFLKANSGQIESVATGSTFKEVSGSALKGLLILIPTAALLEQHTVVIAPSNERSLVIQKETETLTQIRDTLLPQLISGKVRVPEGVGEKTTTNKNSAYET